MNRARVLEQHEKQYAESVASRGDTLSGSTKSHLKTQVSRPNGDRSSQGTSEEPEKVSTYVPVCDRICYNCKQTGHICHNCPQKGRQEAPRQGGTGQGTGNPAPKISHHAAVESKELKEPVKASDELSTEQLQELLVQRQLQKEQQMLESSANTAKANTED